MQDRVPLYPGRVKMTPVSGQANTFDMVRADDPTQEGTPLNKATLLKDATAALYGLGTLAVPDDVLAELGKYKQHWWRKRVPKTTGYIEDLVVANGWLSKGSGNINYAKSISISSAGEITFQSEGAIPITGTFPSTVLDTPINSLKSQLPCYIKTTAGGDFTSSTILYLSENTDITKGDYSGDSDYGIYMSNGYTVTAKYVSNEAGSWQYVYSSNRNAYPDSGTQDGYEYEYLGIPFDNAVTTPKIETGRYIGTGMYGSTYPNTLTFGFVPKFWGWFGYKKATGPTFFPEVALALWGEKTIYLGIDTGSPGNCFSTYQNSSVSWFANSKYEQANQENTTYYYIAIG